MTSRPSLADWLASHLRRSRAAKLAVLSLGVIAAGIVGVALAPVPETLRVFLILLAGLGVVAVSGLYLAYRTLGFARRVSEENLALREALSHVREDLARSRVEAAKDVRQLVEAVERHTGADRAEVGRLRTALPQLQADIQSMKALAGKITTRNDAFDIRLSATTSALERLQLSTASEMVKALDDLRQRDLEARNHLEQIAARLDAVVRDTAAHGKQIGDLSAAHGDVARHVGVAQTVRDKDRDITARLQREIVVLAEVCASAQERTGVLAEQMADVAARIQVLNEFRSAIESELAAVTIDASAAVQRSVMQDRQLQEFRKAAEAESRERYERIAGELRQLQAASRQASVAADALLALQNRHRSLDQRVVEAAREISTALARIEQLREGQEAVQAETSRLASDSISNAALLNALPEQLKATQEEVQKVEAVAEACALQQANSSKQIEEARIVFENFSQATRMQLDVVGAGLNDVAKVRREIADVRGLHAEAEKITTTLGERSEEIAKLAAHTAADVDRLNVAMKDLQNDQAATQATLSERLDQVAAELTTLKAKAGDDPTRERIAKIETDIVDLVRLVDEAEIALADEVTRLGATISQLVENQQGSVADAAAASAGTERLASVENGLAQLTRLVNDSEIATVAELAQLSAVVRELEELRGSGQGDAAAGDAAALDDALRSRLQNAASQLEAAVRVTERALTELGGVSARRQAPEPGSAKRKSPSRPSAKSRAARGPAKGEKH